MDPKQVVEAFCDLMAKRDAEALRPYLADAAVYQNTGMAATTGIEAIIQNLTGQFAMFPHSYAYRVVHAVAQGDIVMTERLDMVNGPDGNVHGLPVMGTFVVKDGKIVRWTDYWDSGLIGKMMAGEDYQDLVPAY